MSYLDFIDPGNSGGSIRIPEMPPFKPLPIVYRCSVCSEEFSKQDELFKHRFENHPFRRPALILRGMEITSPREIVTKPLVAEDIVFANANLFKINGKDYEKLQFVNLLTKQTQGILVVSLANDGVETTYEIELAIPDSDEIKNVECLFFSLLGKEVVDLSRIDAFIDSTEHLLTAKRYIDGLANYLYGLLAKDQRGGTHLEQHEYRSKYNMALDTLKTFETPLSLVICAIINFNQNVFIYSDSSSPVSKLNQVMNKFFCFVHDEKFEYSSLRTGSDFSSVPLDSYTDRLIKWGMMNLDDLYTHRKEIELAIESPDWVVDDRFKARIIVTEMFLSQDNFSAAKKMARKVVNDAIFGDWAQHIMDRSS